MKLKRGTVREDGMVYVSKKSSGGEWWVTREHYERILRRNAEKRLERRMNPELVAIDKEKKKEYRRKNKDRINKVNQEYRIKNKERVKLWPSNIYALNAEKKIAQTKAHYRRNREKIIKKSSEYYKKKKEADPLFRLSCNIRKLLIQTFKVNGHRKKSRTSEILCCSLEEFKAHIESQFLEGMTWENRGEWHLDHIMPASMAKTEDELIRLNHYRNFRPLWAKDNLSKSDKTPDTLVLF
jgi:hypothetical protein